MFSVAEVQTKVINCNSANKSYLLQAVHTKAIAALMQFCNIFYRFFPFFFAKLIPSFSFSWAELAIFPANPATHPPIRASTFQALYGLDLKSKVASLYG